MLNAPGHTSEAVRRAVLEQARETPGAKGNLSAPLTRYVDTVAHHAYKVTDEDVDALRSAGWTEEAIFELTVATALGAALSRRELAREAMSH